MLNWDQKDFTDMRTLQGKLAEVLNRANRERVHAVLAIFAMARLQLQLLHMMNDGEREAFVNQMLVPFLQGREVRDSHNKVITLN